jgi:putative ABC transport system substrate-binding protein
MKTRRALLALLLAAPLAAGAQAGRRPYYRIGVIIGGESRLLRELVEALRDLGYEEGRHYALSVRDYGLDRSRIGTLAEDLLALSPDVLVADASSTAAILKEKTASVPIVVAGAADPVAEGLAASLARPGGNVTGITSFSPVLHARLVEFAHVLLPKARRIAFVVSPDRPLARSQQAAASRAARSLGLELVLLPVRAPWEAQALAERLGRERADVLLVPADAVLSAPREQLLRAGLAAGVPTVSVQAELAEPGALATYGHDAAASWRRAASFVDRILKGANPAELPMEQPTDLELVLNLRTAKALRISIPQAVLLRADRVVE